MKKFISILLLLVVLFSVTGVSQTAVNAASLKTPSVTSITNTNEGALLYWNKVPGATKYRVFVKGGNSKSWKKKADVTSCYYYHSTGKSGTKYTYTVRCVSSNGKKYTSSYNKSGWSNTYYKTPKIYAIDINSKKTVISLKWTNIKAPKYRLFVKSGSGWKKLADTSKCSYNINVSDVEEYSTTKYSTGERSGEKRVYFAIRGLNESSTKYITDYYAHTSKNTAYIYYRKQEHFWWIPNPLLV